MGEIVFREQEDDRVRVRERGFGFKIQIENLFVSFNLIFFFSQIQFGVI
jgi:hypothetical protein